MYRKEWKISLMEWKEFSIFPYIFHTCPFRVPQGVKINSINYHDFLKRNFLPWFKAQPIERRKILFLCRIMLQPMLQSSLRTSSKNSRSLWMKSHGFVPPNSPDLNPIENFWAIK